MRFLEKKCIFIHFGGSYVYRKREKGNFEKFGKPCRT